MRRRFKIKIPGCSAVALAAQLLNAAAQPALPQHWPAEAIIRFSGTSTLHDFGGTLASQPFVLTLSSNTWSAEADVLAAQMNTANDGRDRNMYKMFETNSYPNLHGSVTNAPMPGHGSTNITLGFQIRDKKFDLPVRVDNWNETTGRIQFHTEWDVSLEQYGLKPPSVMGIIRVGEKVHVEADVTVDKSKPAPQPSNP
jgi:hypothetical protein